MKLDRHFLPLWITIFFMLFLSIHEAKAYDENEDRFWLAMNMYHEAGNQSDAGRIAVALVTLNRVNSWGWPDQIDQVVTQGPTYVNWKGNVLPIKNKCQFSWYCDGEPDEPEDSKTWEECLKLANMIMDEGMYDFTHGSTHYHSDKVDPYWNKHLVKVMVIDNHIFYK